MPAVPCIWILSFKAADSFFAGATATTEKRMKTARFHATLRCGGYCLGSIRIVGTYGYCTSTFVPLRLDPGSGFGDLPRAAPAKVPSNLTRKVPTKRTRLSLPPRYGVGIHRLQQQYDYLATAPIINAPRAATVLVPSAREPFTVARQWLCQVRVHKVRPVSTW